MTPRQLVASQIPDPNGSSWNVNHIPKQILDNPHFGFLVSVQFSLFPTATRTIVSHHEVPSPLFSLPCVQATKLTLSPHASIQINLKCLSLCQRKITTFPIFILYIFFPLDECQLHMYIYAPPHPASKCFRMASKDMWKSMIKFIL